jgi:hypothetical protein
MNELKHLQTELTEQERLLEQLRGTRHVVINTRYGGFGLSQEAVDRYKELAGIQDPDWSIYDVARDDAYLVNIVRDMGEDVNGFAANLKVVEIPADVDWIVQEYDGHEWVAERHRTWS